MIGSPFVSSVLFAGMTLDHLRPYKEYTWMFKHRKTGTFKALWSLKSLKNQAEIMQLHAYGDGIFNEACSSSLVRYISNLTQHFSKATCGIGVLLSSGNDEVVLIHHPTPSLPFLLGVRSVPLTYVCLVILGEVMLRWHFRLGSSFRLPTSMWLLCHELPVVSYKHLALLHPRSNLAYISYIISVPPLLLSLLESLKEGLVNIARVSSLRSMKSNAPWWYLLSLDYLLFCFVWPVSFVQIFTNQLMDSDPANWLTLNILVWKTLNQHQVINILLVWRTLNRGIHYMHTTTTQNGTGRLLWIIYYFGQGALSSRDFAPFENLKTLHKFIFTHEQEVDFRPSILCCNSLVVMYWFVSGKLSKLLLYVGTFKPP